jgi:hypothetical protein
MEPIAQATAIILAGASLGWIMLFSFVLSPVAFKQFDAGRAERLVKHVMNSGHGILGLIAFASAIAALMAGAVAALQSRLSAARSRSCASSRWRRAKISRSRVTAC